MKTAIILTGTSLQEQDFCLREICGKSMLKTTVDHAIQAGAESIVVVSESEAVKAAGFEVSPTVDFSSQAVGTTLVLKGNMPLLKSQTMAELYRLADEQGSCVLNDENVGIFCFKNGFQPDLSKAASVSAEPCEWCEVNDCASLYEAEQTLRMRINRSWLNQGVQFLDMNTACISEDTVIGEGSVIYGNVVIYGSSKIGKNVKILPGSWLDHAILHDDVLIDASKIVDSEVGRGTTVGPYSHLRNHTSIGENVRIGNFVEFKNSNFGEGSKCAHLTYIGDSDVGRKVNIGCGVVTVNYDGKHKFRTTIKDGAFVGSNVNIIAPVTVGEKALLAAGSTITEDVADGAMGIARTRQSNKEAFGYDYLNKVKGVKQKW